MNELIKSAGDMVAGVSAAEALGVVVSAGGFMVKEAGKIAIGCLIRPKIEEMLEDFKQAQQDGEIPDGFEKTPHGAALLQEALNALLDGLDQERAEAVKKMFIGLAKNPLEDSLGRAQQLDLMRAASVLTAWEVIAINALERYSVQFFQEPMAASWQQAKAPEARENLKQVAQRASAPFNAWLKENICGNDKTKMESIGSAFKALNDRGILDYNPNHWSEMTMFATFTRPGAFSDFGWKLVQHLYSAKDE